MGIIDLVLDNAPAADELEQDEYYDNEDIDWDNLEIEVELEETVH